MVAFRAAALLPGGVLRAADGGDPTATAAGSDPATADLHSAAAGPATAGSSVVLV